MPPVGLLGRPRAFGLPKEILMSMSNGVEGCEMAAKKPVKQKKAKDLDISKTKGGESVKGGLGDIKGEIRTSTLKTTLRR